MSNEVKKVETSTGKTQLVAQTEKYTKMLINSFASMELEYSEYKKICMINALSKMKEMLNQKGLDFKDIDQSNITSILTKVSMLELNIAASPSECYLQFRNVKQEDGKYKLTFEFGIEGNGNDALLRNYGVDIKSVKGPFVVRDGDEFTYPYFDGEKMNPPTWSPKSYYKKAIKVFYIVEKKDGNKEYLISEREEVVKNLQAHITNNMMGVPEEQKNEIISKISSKTLESILNDTTLRTLIYKKYNSSKKITEDTTIKLISPAWINPQSREDMIVRKMKNNATKKYPKDFKNSFIKTSYESTFEDYEQYRTQDAIDVEEEIQEEVEKQANTEKVTIIETKKTDLLDEKKETINDDCPI